MGIEYDGPGFFAKPINKPPLGIMPEQIWKEHRLTELRQAIDRYIAAELKIPWEWMDEYFRLKKGITV